MNTRHRRRHQATPLPVHSMDESRLGTVCSVAGMRTSVLELPALERTLLWSIRTWGAYHDAPQSIWWVLERAFVETGIRPALEPFAQFMTALFGGLKRYPDIRCVRCLRLGKDENALLATLALAQHQPLHFIAQRLSVLMLPEAAYAGASMLLIMMRLVGSAGRQLQQITDEPASWPPSYQQLHLSTH